MPILVLMENLMEEYFRIVFYENFTGNVIKFASSASLLWDTKQVPYVVNADALPKEAVSIHK